MKITLLNHACVKIQAGGVDVLCDPWLSGSAFNDGWDLLIPTPLDVPSAMEGVTYIWISHEHPDHLSLKFFKDIAEYRATVTILFQKTRDRRVYNALRAKGFTIQEVGPKELVHLSFDVAIRVGPNEFYDSWLWLTDGSTSVLNANDCVLYDRPKLDEVKGLIGAPDVLLTQFSYAAWKGGRENSKYRVVAARNKLDSIAMQISALQPKSVIPFASMVYFSNIENSYLNDHINSPKEACDCIADAGKKAIILYPGDSWEVGTTRDNKPALDRYAAIYRNREALPLRQPGTSVPIEKLREQFANYRSRLFKRNSRLIMTILRYVPSLGAFHPVSIRLTDLNVDVSLSVIDGFRVIVPENCDVSMHSSSLSFILINEFGYDTLTVNGRFEATPEGFSRMTRSLSVGSLNAMGLSVSLALLLRPKVVLILFGRLATVIRQLMPATASNESSSKS